jgi:glucose/arabinose dehydrogenase
MKNRHYLLNASSLAFIIIFILSGCSGEKIPDANGHKVIDCSGFPPVKACIGRILEKTIINCNHWVDGVHILDELHCENTTEGLEEVNFIATPANHIRADMTKEKYTAEVHYNNGGGWDFGFSSDGAFLLTAKDGTISQFVDGRFKPIHKVPAIRHGNAGLHGLVFDQNYDDNHFVYVFYAYTYADNTTKDTRKVLDKISRFVHRNQTLKDEFVLLDEIPGTTHHNGGRIGIGPDGKMYATLGDGDMGDGVLAKVAQNISLLYGKIIRMNLDGSIPKDNPFANSYVYSYGHRNPQGLAWDSSGNLYESEHGNVRHDEINIIKKGGNYGWPYAECEGREDLPSIEPIFCTKEWTLAPSGMVFVDEPNHPWHNSLFVSSLQGTHLHRFEVINGSVTKSEVFYYLNITGLENPNNPNSRAMSRRVRDVAYYNRSLWVLFDQSQYVKLTPVP